MTTQIIMPIEVCCDHYKGHPSGSQLDLCPLSQIHPETKIEIILGSLWNATLQERLEWLRKNAGLQPILMCELGLAEFLTDPRIETAELIAIPLIFAARYRAEQDAQCAMDPQVLAWQPWRDLRRIYMGEVKKKFQELDFGKGLDFRPPVRPIVRKVQDVMKQERLPSPVWITGSSPLYDPSNWNPIRMNFAFAKILEMGQLLERAIKQSHLG